MRNIQTVIVAGWPRCGTTSIHRAVTEQAIAHTYAGKELHYFLKDEVNDEDYLSRFDVKGELGTYRVDVSPSYVLGGELVAKRILSVLGNQVKVLLVTRDPVERAWSHYHHEICNEIAGLSYLREDMAGGTVCGDTFLSPRSIRRYWYADTARRYGEFQAVLGRERVALLDLSEISQDPVGCAGRMRKWLGVSFPAVLQRENRDNGVPWFIYGGETGQRWHWHGKKYVVEPRQLVVVDNKEGRIHEGITPWEWEQVGKSRSWSLELTRRERVQIHQDVFAEDEENLFKQAEVQRPPRGCGMLRKRYCRPTRGLLAKMREEKISSTWMRTHASFGEKSRVGVVRANEGDVQKESVFTKVSTRVTPEAEEPRAGGSLWERSFATDEHPESFLGGCIAAKSRGDWSSVAAIAEKWLLLCRNSTDAAMWLAEAICRVKQCESTARYLEIGEALSHSVQQFREPLECLKKLMRDEQAADIDVAGGRDVASREVL